MTIAPTSMHLSSPLRGAILGAGGISEYHLRAWREVEDVRIVAIADIQQERAEIRAREFGIGAEHVYSDCERLLRDESLDFIDIATPPHLHCRHVLAAAKQKVHVLCQKPFATSMDEANRMIEACQRAGIRCVVNENYRWRNWYREVKRLIDGGTIGTVHYARFYYHGDNVFPQADGSMPLMLAGQPYMAEMPRLILFEWGIHLIDVMRFLLGDIESVYAWTKRTSPLVQGEDSAVVNLKFKNDALGLIDISWASRIADGTRSERGSVDSLVLEGESGTIELARSQNGSLIITLADGSQDVRPIRGEAYHDSFHQAQAHFIQSLKSGQPAENDARDNLQTLEATLAAYLAAERNQVCKLTVDRGLS